LRSSSSEQHDIGNLDRGFLVDNAAGFPAAGITLDVFLHHVDVFHQQASIVETLQYIAALAFAAAGDHNDFVTFLNLLHNSYPA
jgi:hypothetical protein